MMLFFTYDSSYNSYYNSFYNSCYLYSGSPPVKLVLITEEGIQRQLSEMRENKPWTQVSSWKLHQSKRVEGEGKARGGGGLVRRRHHPPRLNRTLTQVKFSLFSFKSV